MENLQVTDSILDELERDEQESMCDNGITSNMQSSSDEQGASSVSMGMSDSASEIMHKLDIVGLKNAKQKFDGTFGKEHSSEDKRWIDLATLKKKGGVAS